MVSDIFVLVQVEKSCVRSEKPTEQAEAEVRRPPVAVAVATMMSLAKGGPSPDPRLARALTGRACAGG